MKNEISNEFALFHSGFCVIICKTLMAIIAEMRVEQVLFGKGLLKMCIGVRLLKKNSLSLSDNGRKLKG